MFEYAGAFNYGSGLPMLQDMSPTNVEIVSNTPSVIDMQIIRGQEIVCYPPIGKTSCTFQTVPAYSLSRSLNENQNFECVDEQFLKQFLGNVSPYQLAYFENYFHLDVVDSSNAEPEFTITADKCAVAEGAVYTHQAEFAAAHSPRETLYVPFSSGHQITLLFNADDLLQASEGGPHKNPRAEALLLFETGNETRQLSITDAKDVYVLLQQTR